MPRGPAMTRAQVAQTFRLESARTKGLQPPTSAPRRTGIFKMTHTYAYAFSKPFVICAAAASLLTFGGCAATGPSSPSARPVLYPNATLNRVGAVQGQAEAGACVSRAMSAGLTPDEKNNEVARRAGEGAATAGVASAIGALITGRGSDMLRAGAAGAAIGGSAGAASGAFHNDRPNLTYRHFVQRCLSEKGFDVMGWN